MRRRHSSAAAGDYHEAAIRECVCAEEDKTPTGQLEERKGKEVEEETGDDKEGVAAKSD